MKKHHLIPVALLVALSMALPAEAKKPAAEGGDVPHGMQKKVARGGELPPGWQKRLKKGEVLAPEVVSHGEPVSEQLRVKLPVGEKGSIDITLDGKVIRLDEVSRKVLDVFEVRL